MHNRAGSPFLTTHLETRDGWHERRVVVCFNACVNPRVALGLALVVWWAGIGDGHAHHSDPFSELQDATFCLDQSSVEIESQGADLNVVKVGTRAGELIGARLSSLDVAWIGKEICDDTTDHLILSISARYLDPKTYRNFPADSYSIFTVLRIEPAAGSDHVFLSTASELYSAKETGTQLEDHLLSVVRASTTKLAGDWWVSNPLEARASFSLWPGGLAVVLLTVMATIVLLGLQQRRRRGMTVRHIERR